MANSSHTPLENKAIFSERKWKQPFDFNYDMVFAKKTMIIEVNNTRERETHFEAKVR